MDVINKLYFQVSNSVSSTVSQLSGVLPGNPVTREFDATIHIASGGAGLLWKIYKGIKRSTKQEASIFVFEKRQLEKWNKADREIILINLRRGVTQLTKIRHPQILTVQHSLEESRESLAFATEPVFASLANILGNTVNMPQPATSISEYLLYDIEIKYGILQISQGLAFLHNDMKLLHKNITPENIIINKEGVWKIFGFDFAVQNTNPINLPPSYPCESYTSSISAICQSNIAYIAPEIILSQKQSTASDMFSFGLTIYAVYSKELHTLPIVRNIQEYRSRLQQLNNLNINILRSIPDTLREYAKRLLNVSPENRLDAVEFTKIPFFEDFGVKTLNHLEQLLQWDNIQKSHFYKGLPEALEKLPQRVKVQRVLTCLSRDLAQPVMVPFILPNIFDIAEKCNKEEFYEHILPVLKPIMKLMEPIQVLLIMLQKMEILLRLTPPEDIQLHVLPMLHRGLDCNNPQIHELCLAIIPDFAGLLDQHNVKNGLLPRIKRLCLTTSSLPVRVNCLLCLGKLLQHLNKWLVIDEILPFLPQIPSREPAVLMGIVGIYKFTMIHKKLGMGKEIIARRVLPFLIPLIIENGLSINQFNSVVALTKDMLSVVEAEHRSKLEQVNSVKDEEKTLTLAMPSIENDEIQKPLELDNAFQGLDLDKFIAPTKVQKLSIPTQSSMQPSIQRFTSLTQSNSKDLTVHLQHDSDLLSSKDASSPSQNAINQQFQHFELQNTISNQTFSPKNSIANQALNYKKPINYNLTPDQTRSGNTTDWNLLDSLLSSQVPFNNATNKVPMNQLLPNGVNKMESANESNTALSKDEILDFLK